MVSRAATSPVKGELDSSDAVDDHDTVLWSVSESASICWPTLSDSLLKEKSTVSGSAVRSGSVFASQCLLRVRVRLVSDLPATWYGPEDGGLLSRSSPVGEVPTGTGAVTGIETT